MGHCSNKNEKKLKVFFFCLPVCAVHNLRPDYHTQSFHRKTLGDTNSKSAHWDQRAYRAAYQEHRFVVFHQQRQLDFLLDRLISKMFWKKLGLSFG